MQYSLPVSDAVGTYKILCTSDLDPLRRIRPEWDKYGTVHAYFSVTWILR